MASADQLDAVLVAAARDGDQAAFATLFARHRDAVRRTVMRVVGSSERGPDLVQDTFVRALVRLSTLRDASCFRPWLLRVARNLAIDDVRGRAAIAAHELDADATPGDAAIEPPNVVERVRIAAVVRAGMAALPERDGVALAMSVRGLPIADIARRLGVSRTNAKVIVHRARRRLRDAVRSADAA